MNSHRVPYSGLALPAPTAFAPGIESYAAATRRFAWQGIRAIGRLVRLWRDYRAALRELESLSDADLRDLRFKRIDLSEIAWDEARRRADAARGR
ncbi:MAG TPA: hypothetical protein VEK73_13195 [Xanthobacteraceae bacterium]|nr:hypothetical protein [Xanthobacteraceae bacterium]